jgi:hypothetical protein
MTSLFRFLAIRHESSNRPSEKSRPKDSFSGVQTYTPSGQSLLELAISLMVILLLLSGAVNFGLALFAFIQTRDAAQEGALYASINPTNEDEIRDRVCDLLSSLPDGSDCDYGEGHKVSLELTRSVACEGNPISMSVRYDYPVFMPFLAIFINSNTISLKATATDIILQPFCP